MPPKCFETSKRNDNSKKLRGGTTNCSSRLLLAHVFLTRKSKTDNDNSCNGEGLHANAAFNLIAALQLQEHVHL